MLARWASVKIFGPSIISLRLVSVAFGVSSVLLCYVLIRHFAAPKYALVGAALLATDSAHLFWSRIEASQIVAATTGAAIAGLVAVWLGRTLSPSAALIAMLWTPMTRYFYASILAVAVLPALILTAAGPRRLFARRTFPTLILVLAGLVLWLASSSSLHSIATGNWKPISPFSVYGEPMFKPHDPAKEHTDLSAPGQIEFQLRRLVHNSARMVEHMGSDRPRYSNWLMMAQPDDQHRRSISAPVFALLAPTFGFMIGASRDPGIRSLGLWLIVLPLAGLFSVDPGPRRIAGFFLATHVAVALFLSEVTTALPLSSRSRSLVATLVVVSVVPIGLTGLTSHLLVGQHKPGIIEYIRYMKPVFKSHDAIYHNIEDRAAAATIVFGNADLFFNRRPCFTYGNI